MRFRTALMWNGVSIMGSSGITLFSTIILSRMLTPADFAIIGIVNIFIMFSQMMVDSEMGGALLRKSEVDRLDYSTLFYYNFAISLLIYSILYFCAPLIADFYDNPALVGVIRVISLTIIIHAFRVVQRIIIFRGLRYRIYAIINVASGVLSLVVAVILAYKGCGYWALVWQQVAGAVFNVIFLCLHTRFIPLFKFSKRSFRYQFSFGINLVGSDIIRTVANNISTNIIAKISSLTFTGYYTQTSRLSNFTQSTFGGLMDQTVFPMLSKLHTRAEVRRMFYRILTGASICVVVVSIVFEIFAFQIIRIVLGTQWIEATWVFQLLCLSILPSTIQVLCRNILKTLAETKKVFYLETAKSSIIILALFLGVVFDDYGVIAGLVISQYLGALLWLIVTHKETLKSGEITNMAA